MVDLTTTYLGLELKNPLVASASPLSEKVETVVELERAGVSAVVMYSLFEEQITHELIQSDFYREFGTESYSEALTYFPELARANLGPEPYLGKLAAIKAAVDIPVIGSLNGASKGKWIEYSRRIEDTGADALELNLYYLSTDPDLTGAELEDVYVDLVHNIRMAVEFPLAVKLSPFFTSLPNLARRLVEAGADGLVLFNRFYQPDFDLEELEVVTNLILSNSDELRLPLRWMAILYGQINADFALTSGVHTAEDTLKALMAGANTVMVASALLQDGVGAASQILQDLEAWLEEHEYASVRQLIGSMSQRAVANPAAFERANYMKALKSFKSLP